MAQSSGCVNWFFGRGLSMACNLLWSVPTEWQNLPREEKIDRIKTELREEMDKQSINRTVIQRLLGTLGTHTAPNWRHRFITTNWDYLLQREIQLLDLVDKPDWMENSHVYHLNGTVEELEDNSNRSPFLLEEDPAAQRCFTPEADTAFGFMLQGRTFVVVGMSFECVTDKFLLSAIRRAEDDMPIGESIWIVVNRDPQVVELSCSRIACALPHATVKRVCESFDDWLNGGLQELQQCGAIAI